MVTASDSAVSILMPIGTRKILMPTSTRIDGQRVLQVLEAVDGGGQREVQRAQAEDGEDVRGVDDEGILRDGEDGGNRIDREDQVDELHHDQRHEQRA